MISVLADEANNQYDPRESSNNYYLFNNESEEQRIIAHPGLSEELRLKYISNKKYRIDQDLGVCEFIQTHPNILNIIGQYGLLFLNVKLSENEFIKFIRNFMNKIGDDSPLLEFELFKAPDFF